MIINKWIQCGVVPSPAEVSQEEGIGFLFINGKPRLHPQFSLYII